jgi:hypothetical protein
LIPVYQTVIDKWRGNCLQAAMASMFHLELEQVPHFILYEDWFKVFWHWLHALDHEYIGSGYQEHIADAPLVNDALYCSVKSKLFPGGTHAVLINREGIVIHDPNPKKLFLGENVVESGAFDSLLMIGPLKEVEQ